ncbi:MAG: ornithine decarboxylase [Dialister sp.]|nr:ornithine decarboxylase [Dialister sp.]
MESLKLAYSENACRVHKPNTSRPITKTTETDFLDVAAVVITDEDKDVLENEAVRAFNIPIIVILTKDKVLDQAFFGRIRRVIDLSKSDQSLYDLQIEEAAHQYEDNLKPPFFKALQNYIAEGNSRLATPGHHGGQYFCAHPAGRLLYEYYGANIFKSDFSSSDVAMGDLLIHESTPVESEKFAASVFKADKTYFVLNGTSSSNKIVLNAVLAPGDVVLYDRNNHKSISQGALVQSGATPIYLETARNPYGSIGGILEHCFDETYIRKLVAEKCPEKAKEKRPIRLAVIQLGTYDGCIYNARQVVDKIGHLCDYILFDSAWVGYEEFIPMMKNCSPLLLDLGPDDPGIFVTQSVHKQMAGFSQASQIHKKDSHIKGQDRYVPHKRLNNAFMLHASTSPFYPIFTTLDVNARMHQGKEGEYLWKRVVRNGIELRKLVLRNCKYFRPLVPPMVHGKKWEDGKTADMANDIEYWAFEPDAAWHSFKGYGKGQYFIDPCKLQLVTPGIDMKTGGYEKEGIPANVLANYLRENGVIPEKTDLNAILFLLTPGESMTKLSDLVDKLVEFERLYDEDVLMKDMLPGIYAANEEKYKGYHIKRLCAEMHEFYKDRKVNILQRQLFTKEYLPDYVMDPHEANAELVRGHGELVPLCEAEGRVALEGALPYPPGILCEQPGERWSATATKYFLALEEGINMLPGFSPEIQGVYLEDTGDGKKKAFGYVLKKEYEPKSK